MLGKARQPRHGPRLVQRRLQREGPLRRHVRHHLLHHPLGLLVGAPGRQRGGEQRLVHTIGAPPGKAIDAWAGQRLGVASRQLDALAKLGDPIRQTGDAPLARGPVASRKVEQDHLDRRPVRRIDDLIGNGPVPIPPVDPNDVSAYIPTNVISITDGQIFLQSDLFNANQRPAVDVGISVSRVGGDAQVKSIKKVSGTLKLELAQYRSLEAFAMFASDLDAASRRQLARGARLTELLRQPQYSPYPVEEQVVSIWAGTKGKLDSIEVTDVLRFEKELLEHLRRNTKILDTLRETNVLDDKTESELDSAVDKFIAAFQGGKNGGVKAGKEEFDAMADADVEQAKIVKPRKRK